jgi:hypothetical protein
MGGKPSRYVNPLTFRINRGENYSSRGKSKQDEKKLAINRGSFYCKAQPYRLKKAPKHLEEKSCYKVT